MTGQLHMMNAGGHTTLTWDTETENRNPVEGPVHPDVAVARFDEMRAQGQMGVSTDPKTGEKEQVSGNYDPKEHPEVTMVPPMAGGRA